MYIIMRLGVSKELSRQYKWSHHILSAYSLSIMEQIARGVANQIVE